MKRKRTKKGVELFTDEQINTMNKEKESKRVKSKEEKLSKAKGSVQSQLDYIVKNGLEAYIAEMKTIEGEIQ
jgi:hypothetical protein